MNDPLVLDSNPQGRKSRAINDGDSAPADPQKIALITAAIGKLPSLPVTVTKVIEICNDKAASPIDLNRVIALDPVLMARILKLINSAYYGIPGQITSLVRAIIMLGLNTVKNLALSSAVLASLGKPEHFAALNMTDFWRHSLATGVIAKLIGKVRGVSSNRLEEFFVAGLLHDLGKIPINSTLPEDFTQAMSLAERYKVPLVKAERRVMAFDHTSIGNIIATDWKLGGEITDAVTYHHDPMEYSGANAELVNTVYLASFFANTLFIGFSGDRFPEKLDPGILSMLNVGTDIIQTIKPVVGTEITKAEVFLNLGNEK